MTPRLMTHEDQRPDLFRVAIRTLAEQVAAYSVCAQFLKLSHFPSNNLVAPSWIALAFLFLLALTAYASRTELNAETLDREGFRKRAVECLALAVSIGILHEAIRMSLSSPLELNIHPIFSKLLALSAALLSYEVVVVRSVSESDIDRIPEERAY